MEPVERLVLGLQGFNGLMWKALKLFGRMKHNYCNNRKNSMEGRLDANNYR